MACRSPITEYKDGYFGHSELAVVRNLNFFRLRQGTTTDPIAFHQVDDGDENIFGSVRSVGGFICGRTRRVAEDFVDCIRAGFDSVNVPGVLFTYLLHILSMLNVNLHFRREGFRIYW